MKTDRLRIAMIVIAVILIVIGILQGDPLDVFIKASKICAECIGIG